jgi:hypothetical protein
MRDGALYGLIIADTNTASTFSFNSLVCLSRHCTICDITRSEVKRRKSGMKKETKGLRFSIHHCAHPLNTLCLGVQVMLQIMRKKIGTCTKQQR